MGSGTQLGAGRCEAGLLGFGMDAEAGLLGFGKDSEVELCGFGRVVGRDGCRVDFEIEVVL